MKVSLKRLSDFLCCSFFISDELLVNFSHSIAFHTTSTVLTSFYSFLSTLAPAPVSVPPPTTLSWISVIGVQLPLFRMSDAPATSPFEHRTFLTVTAPVVLSVIEGFGRSCLSINRRLRLSYDFELSGSWLP